MIVAELVGRAFTRFCRFRPQRRRAVASLFSGGVPERALVVDRAVEVRNRRRRALVIQGDEREEGGGGFALLILAEVLGANVHLQVDAGMAGVIGLRPIARGATRLAAEDERLHVGDFPEVDGVMKSSWSVFQNLPVPGEDLVRVQYVHCPSPIIRQYD